MTEDIPAKDLEQLQELLRLKNYETPGEGYIEEVLSEFHRRQRINRTAAVVSTPSFFETAQTWFRDLGAAKWAVAAGGVYALLLIGFFMAPSQSLSPNSVVEESPEILPGDRRLEHVELIKPVEKDDEQNRTEENPSQNF